MTILGGSSFSPRASARLRSATSAALRSCRSSALLVLLDRRRLLRLPRLLGQIVDLPHRRSVGDALLGGPVGGGGVVVLLDLEQRAAASHERRLRPQLVNVPLAVKALFQQKPLLLWIERGNDLMMVPTELRVAVLNRHAIGYAHGFVPPVLCSGGDGLCLPTCIVPETPPAFIQSPSAQRVAVLMMASRFHPGPIHRRFARRPACSSPCRGCP